MASSTVVTFVLFSFILTVSGGRVRDRSLVMNEKDRSEMSDQALLKLLSEEADLKIPPLQSSDIQDTIASEEVDDFHSSDSAGSERFEKPVKTTERTAKVPSEVKDVEKAKGAPSPEVIGPAVRDAEKEHGLRARGVGPKPLGKWLDSLAGEARRIVWSVGPQLRE